MTNTTFKLEEVELKNDNYPRPTGHRILIKTLDIANKTNMGIYLPSNSIEDHRAIASIGKVVEVGSDASKREEMTGPWCKVGDYVMFGNYAGHRFKYGQAELRIMHKSGICRNMQEICRNMQQICGKYVGIYEII